MGIPFITLQNQARSIQNRRLEKWRVEIDAGVEEVHRKAPADMKGMHLFRGIT